MFHLKDNFTPGGPISQVPASWFNAVARFLNNIVGGYGINITKDGVPTVCIDPKVLATNAEKATKEYQQMETPSADNLSVSAGHQENQLLTTEWRRGTKGIKIYLPTDSWGDNVSRSIAWRLCEFDRYGRLVHVGKQTIRTESVNMNQLFS
jgi:hypothetical protein